MINGNISSPNPSTSNNVEAELNQPELNIVSAVQQAYNSYRVQMDKILNSPSHIPELNGLGSGIDNFEIKELKKQVNFLSQKLTLAENQIQNLSNKCQQMRNEKDAMEGRFNAELLQLRTEILAMKRDSNSYQNLQGTSEFSNSREASSEPIDMSRFLNNSNMDQHGSDMFANEHEDIKPTIGFPIEQQPNLMPEISSSSKLTSSSQGDDFQSYDDFLSAYMPKKRCRQKEGQRDSAVIYAKWINSLTPEQKEMVRRRNTENQRRRRMRLKLLKEGLKLGINPYTNEVSANATSTTNTNIM